MNDAVQRSVEGPRAEEFSTPLLFSGSLFLKSAGIVGADFVGFAMKATRAAGLV